MKKISPKQLIEKNPIFESLFMPLYFKAVETQSNNPLIVDHKAVELLGLLDYDFAYIGKQNKAVQFHVSVRTKILDEQVTKFINEAISPIIIVNLGSGLDTRYSRISSQHVKCWYDIDLPEVIEFRNNFFEDTESFKSIGKSVLDFSWINDIEKDQADTVLFIAEGLLMYFNESDIKEIFNQINQNFSSAMMLCEVFHTKLLEFQLKNKKNNKDLSFSWGISDTEELESMHADITIENEWRVNEYHKNKQRLLIRILGMILPEFKNLIKIIKLRFNETSTAT
jgi:O-methyltransferase involved in polyketide biosynthesis